MTKKNLNRNAVTVFFASDDKYLPYLEVAIASLAEHASSGRAYNIYVLSTRFSEGSLDELKALVTPNITISVCNLCDKIDSLKSHLRLRLRDYYSESIYYRMFIPSLFPKLRRAVYLDSDIVLLDDVAKLYDAPLGDCIIGAVTDESVIAVPEFREYVEGYIGALGFEKYFNSGVLVMDLDGFRRERIEDKFLYLLKKYNFPTVAPDQDYLNFLCRGKVRYLPSGWNKHATAGEAAMADILYLIHYNMFNKPWHYDNVPYEEYFWRYVDKVPSADALYAEKSSYTDTDRENDKQAGGRLVASACEILKTEKPIYEVITPGFFDSVFN